VATWLPTAQAYNSHNQKAEVRCISVETVERPRLLSANCFPLRSLSSLEELSDFSMLRSYDRVQKATSEPQLCFTCFTATYARGKIRGRRACTCHRPHFWIGQGFILKNFLDQTLRESAKGLALSHATKRLDLTHCHQHVRVNVPVVAGSRSS
jgi:hypothetical protein